MTTTRMLTALAGIRSNARSRPFFHLAIFVLSALGAPSLRADLIETAPFSLIGSPNQGTVSLPQFNPAQGTLNSATLTVSGTIQFVLETFNTGPGAVTVTAHDTFFFGGTPLPTKGVFTATIPSNQPIYTFMPPPVPLGVLTEFFGPNTVSFFTGTATLPFQLSLGAATVDEFSGLSTSGVLAFAGVSGSVTADYAFTPTPSPAPEPASFGLAGLALIAAALCRRKSRGPRKD